MTVDFLDILQDYALKHQAIEEETLRDLYFRHSPDSDEFTFFWDLQNWKEERLLSLIEHKRYKVRRIFKPSPSDLALKLVHNLAQDYDLEPYCLIQSNWYNQFSRHQSPKNLHILEFEKEICESIFYHLKDEGYPEVFLLLEKKDYAILERYAFEAKNPIIIRKIVSKAPTQSYSRAEKTIRVPYLEKMLIDLFADEQLLVAYKGAEQKTVIENMLNNYVIDFKKLFAYVQRRRKEKDLKKYLFENFSQEINQII